MITAPAPAPPLESGVSAVRDVMLEPGVPELARGRRPVAPPFARMSATTGAVEVSFSVSAGGTTALQTATGTDLLRYSAEQTVASWVFRRSRAERAYLVAVFTYSGDKASAVVRPQAAPATPASRTGRTHCTRTASDALAAPPGASRRRLKAKGRPQWPPRSSPRRPGLDYSDFTASAFFLAGFFFASAFGAASFFSSFGASLRAALSALPAGLYS